MKGKVSAQMGQQTGAASGSVELVGKHPGNCTDVSQPWHWGKVLALGISSFGSMRSSLPGSSCGEAVPCFRWEQG